MKTHYGWALASVMLLGGIGSAHAADMAVKARPMVAPAPVWNWTGFYIGGNVGYIDREGTDTAGSVISFNPAVAGAVPGSAASAAAATFRSGRTEGVLGGIQAGYNWQVSPKWVFGVEADIDGTSIDRTSTTLVSVPVVGFPGVINNSTDTVRDRLEYLGTLRARFGFLASPSFLLYGTGGLAYGRATSTVTISQTYTGAPGVPASGVGVLAIGNERAGWTAGAGAEWMFAHNWSAKVEGLYYDLGHIRGTSSFNQFAGGGVVPFYTTGFSSDARIAGVLARVGVNYHFGGPVVAKY